MRFDRGYINMVLKDKVPYEVINPEDTHSNDIAITKIKKKDSTRAYMMEQIYHNINIYCVTKPKDTYYDNPNNNKSHLYIDWNSSDFISHIKHQDLKFKEMYVNNYGITADLLMKSYGEGFFQNIVNIAKENILESSEDANPRVYLPFTPSFFSYVHSTEGLKDYYSISYLKKDEITESNHKLSHCTQQSELLYECVMLDDEGYDEHTSYSKESIYTFNDFFS